MGFEDGRILKVMATGGTGAHMFNVQKASGGFAHLSPGTTKYMVGSHEFESAVTTIAPAIGETMIGLSNGKILKVSGTGGTGLNMFNIVPVTLGFNSGSGQQYLIGSTNFNVGVSQILYVRDGSVTFVLLRNGAVTKIRRTGGTGFNMFGLVRDDTLFGFYRALCGFYWYLGGQNLYHATCQK